MRKVFTTCVLLLAASAAPAAQILWDCVKNVPGNGDYWMPDFEWFGSRSDGATFRLQICYLLDGIGSGEWRLRGGPGWFSGTVYEASREEIVDYEYAKAATPVFTYMGSIRDSWPEDTAVTVETGKDFYLAFMLESTGQKKDEYIYGWVQMQVTSVGELELLHSALDLDGGPMIVGGGSAIPEPSGGVLILLGAAVLGLRRRRGGARW